MYKDVSNGWNGSYVKSHKTSHGFLMVSLANTNQSSDGMNPRGFNAFLIARMVSEGNTLAQ